MEMPSPCSKCALWSKKNHTGKTQRRLQLRELLTHHPVGSKKKKKFVFQEDVKCFKKALTYITVAKGQPIH